jgi:hypothetical protein
LGNAFSFGDPMTEQIKVRRAIPPPTPTCACSTVDAILLLTAQHLRNTIPAFADLTAADFDTALSDLRPQLRELIADEIHDALLDDREDRQDVD